jgi:hypothetical protein
MAIGIGSSPSTIAIGRGAKSLIEISGFFVLKYLLYV